MQDDMPVGFERKNGPSQVPTAPKRTFEGRTFDWFCPDPTLAIFDEPRLLGEER